MATLREKVGVRISSFKRHRVKDYFSRDDLARIEEAVKESGEKTVGKIRVKIVSDLKLPQPKGKATESERLTLQVVEEAARSGNTRAVAEWYFGAEGLNQIGDHISVLIFVVLKERKSEIFVDRTITQSVPQEVWDGIARDLALSFGVGNLTAGIIAVVLLVGTILGEHFPKGSGTGEAVLN